MLQRKVILHNKYNHHQCSFINTTASKQMKLAVTRDREAYKKQSSLFHTCRAKFDRLVIVYNILCSFSPMQHTLHSDLPRPLCLCTRLIQLQELQLLWTLSVHYGLCYDGFHLCCCWHADPFRGCFSCSNACSGCCCPGRCCCSCSLADCLFQLPAGDATVITT